MRNTVSGGDMKPGRCSVVVGKNRCTFGHIGLPAVRSVILIPRLLKRSLIFWKIESSNCKGRASQF